VCIEACKINLVFDLPTQGDCERCHNFDECRCSRGWAWCSHASNFLHESNRLREWNRKLNSISIRRFNLFLVQYIKLTCYVVTLNGETGWRSEQKTRRLIVVSTDGPLHIAGDGKVLIQSHNFLVFLLKERKQSRVRYETQSSN